MAIRSVVKSDEPILREKSRPVTDFSDRLWQLLDDMRETMLFEEGVGLAAVQIGVLRRVCVISMDGETFYELINPIFLQEEGTQICNEGCLSIAGVNGRVVRPLSVTVKALDRFNKEQIINAEGRLADILCHEIDHLDGILFTDKMIGPVLDSPKTLKGSRKLRKR